MTKVKKLPLLPLNDCVLVEITEETHGGLTLANPDANESIQRGVCVAVGEGTYRSGQGWALTEDIKARDFLIGKTVLWQKYADKDATFDKYGERKFVLIKIAQLVAYEQ